MTIRLGDIAPDFTVDTTDGTISFHDWKAGSWAILFSHPADFTPVCTTELGRTASLKGELEARNVKAIAVSVDPVDSHRAWAGDISAVGGVDLNFPIVAPPRWRPRPPVAASRPDRPSRRRRAQRGRTATAGAVRR